MENASEIKVSVIIPTHNRANYICQAIDSVLQQTMQNFEVIVVDDGSTDDTIERIKKYGDKIHYIYTQNGGPAHARNTGMAAARGEYLAFLDSDDLYYQYKLQLQVDVLDKFPDVAMVSTEISAFDDAGYLDEYHLKKYHNSAFRNGRVTYDTIYSENMLLKTPGIDAFHNRANRIYLGNIFDTYLHHIVIMTTTVMIRRNILSVVGMQNAKYWLCEDYEFALRICKHYRVAFVDVPTYKVRYHPDQISTIKKENGINVTIRIQQNLLEIAETHGLNDREYYIQNKTAMDERLAIMHRALAIPLMAKGKQPKIAREHLRDCGKFGHPEHFLRMVTFTPYLIRRFVVKALAILKMY
jgi:glycosyltransferase involved in cell wall biosynthesis